MHHHCSEICNERIFLARPNVFGARVGMECHEVMHDKQFEFAIRNRCTPKSLSRNMFAFGTVEIQ